MGFLTSMLSTRDFPMKSPLSRWLLGVSLLGVAACAATLPQVTLQDAERLNLPLADLREGRSRYVAKCGGCHPLHNPLDYTDAQWAHQVEEMTSQARLTAEDTRLILSYLRAMNRE